MPEYTPPPPNLDHLNPIQRYMQKGHLDRQDWLRLIAIVLAYFILRPYIEKAAKWFFGGSEMVEGEKAQSEYQQRRAKAIIGANSIRGLNKSNDDDIVIAGQKGTAASGAQVEDRSRAVNRKTKGISASKSEIDKLVDWDDEPERHEVEGDKSDVIAWLDKWDK